MTTKNTSGITGRSRFSWSQLGGALSRRFWLLASSRLCAEARRRTGLEDFGEPCIEPALRVLTESLEKEAQLHPLGRFLMRIHLCGLLETRLKLALTWSHHSASLHAQPIKKPVFIVGMPRSGSTFLHELLAQNCEYRSPRVWEVMFPVPSARGSKKDVANRIRKAEACLWWFRRLVPRADAVYPMRAMTPHECVAIQSYTFLSQEFVSTCCIPAYESFLLNTDLIPAYQWERKFLQFLQLGAPARRWVLKSPDHVYGLEELFAVFPDALIIQTHRNPVEVLKSSADLTQALRGLYGAPGDPAALRAREARVLAEGTDRFIRFRDRHPELANRFIDVKYTELVVNPLNTVRQICSQLDTPLTQADTERIERLAVSRSRYRGRRVSTEPIGLKLDASTEISQFERYCSRFDLPFSEADVAR